MRKRPFVWLISGYVLFLFAVLIVWPETGETVFRWNQIEQQNRSLYSSGLWIAGWVEQVQNDGTQMKIRLEDGQAVTAYSAQPLSVSAGQPVRLLGEIRWPEAASNPGQWDARFYARLHHIAFSLQVQKIEQRDAAVRWDYAVLGAVRDRLGKAVDMLWSEPWNGILKAMILGDKSDLDDTVSSQFRSGGISHIMAISGLHLTLIADLLRKLLQRFHKVRRAHLEAAAFLWAYVLLTGAAVSTVRAAIMVSIRTAAKLAGREEDFPTVCAVTAGFLLAYQPLYLLDAGFCLSFAALLGLRYGKIWTMALPGISYRLRRLLSASLAVSLATAPISLWFFYETSVYGFLLNLWVIPMAGVLLMSGLAGILLSLIHPALGKGPALLAQGILWAFQRGSQWIGTLPGANLTGKPEGAAVLLYYCLLGAVLFYYQHPALFQRKLAIALCAAGLGFSTMGRQNRWRVAYLDVGQGDCSVIEWKGSVWIVDAGPQYEEVIRPYLKYRGIRTVDALILSHPDQDHMEGMLLLAEDPDFQIEALFVAGAACQNTEQRVRLQQMVQERGGAVWEAGAGTRIQTGEMTGQILLPDRESAFFDSNESSLVMALDIEGWHFLYTGDIGISTENAAQAVWEKTDVLKTAHHGSRGSTGSLFLQKTDPELAVISCGQDNIYGHPHEETLNRLKQQGVEWLTTAEYGAVWVEEYGGQLQYSYFRKDTEQ